jgi:AcrR family transcriptional regulator
MGKKSGPNKLNLLKTRNVFLDIGREEFVKNGYSGTSTNVIVDRADMARGSLYYHFGDKQGLFKAVFEDLLQKTDRVIQLEMQKYDDPLDKLKAGAKLFLKLCTDNDFRKIALIEGISTIPYNERIEIVEQNLIGSLKDIIRECRQENYFSHYHEHILMFFLYGLLSETGRSFERVDDPEMLYKLACNSLDNLLDQISTP